MAEIPKHPDIEWRSYSVRTAELLKINVKKFRYSNDDISIKIFLTFTDHCLKLTTKKAF